MLNDPLNYVDPLGLCAFYVNRFVETENGPGYWTVDGYFCGGGGGGGGQPCVQPGRVPGPNDCPDGPGGGGDGPAGDGPGILEVAAQANVCAAKVASSMRAQSLASFGLDANNILTGALLGNDPATLVNFASNLQYNDGAQVVVSAVTNAATIVAPGATVPQTGQMVSQLISYDNRKLVYYKLPDLVSNFKYNAPLKSVFPVATKVASTAINVFAGAKALLDFGEYFAALAVCSTMTP